MLTISNSATNELSPVDALAAFKINDDGSVTSTDSISSQGNGPAFTVQYERRQRLNTRFDREGDALANDESFWWACGAQLR